MGGQTWEYTCPRHVTLLNQALDEGIPAPFSCMNGVCTTCKAKLLKGEVAMEPALALDPEEKEEGWILTCQAYPRSELVTFEIGG